MATCKSVNCGNEVTQGEDFCLDCHTLANHRLGLNILGSSSTAMSGKRPMYFKSVEHLTEIDVYGIHHLFEVKDSSGCLQHASKKILLTSTNTDAVSTYDDISEAKDILVRWLQLNKPETQH